MPDPTNIATPAQRQAIRDHAKLTKRTQAAIEATAIKQVAEQAHGTAQLAIRALHAIASREIELAKFVGTKDSILVISSPAGLSLGEDICNQLSGLLGISVLPITKEHDVSLLDDEALAKLGLMKIVRVVTSEQ